MSDQQRRTVTAWIAALLRTLLEPDRVDYAGATCTAADARDLFTRWRRGECLLDGPHIARFEQALSEYHGGPFVVTFGAGRQALYAILKALEVPEGSEIILPGYTCIVTPIAIQRAGLKPVYVDVSRQDFNILPELIERAITPRTAAILAQHTFGIPCDMNALLDIQERRGVPVIEDGAHAIGARWRGEPVGRLGRAAFFSTQATKMLSTERGGYAVTDDADLAARMRRIQREAAFCLAAYERASLARWWYRAAWRQDPTWNPRLRLVEYLLRYLHAPGVRDVLEYDRVEYRRSLEGEVTEPFPSRLGNLMAYAGLRQLRRIELDLAHRRRMVAYLEAELPALGVRVASYDHRLAQPSWLRFPFVVADRGAWLDCVRRAGLTPDSWLDDPIHPAGSNSERVGYTRNSCPNGEYLARHVMNIPVDRRVNLARLQRWVRFARQARGSNQP